MREADLDLTPRTAGFACTTLAARVTAPDPAGPLLLVNHFPGRRLDVEYERELQAVAAARLIEENRLQRRVSGVPDSNAAALRA
ncbi:hypothetical protein [Actinomadura algeriensis]|uniref:Uncharacterized protein n=1 Tax=Actinomadura algeriensis TaxID=1679523 RepID=A0ABR9JRU8_9ACTN|nr:hypothetical protein [Actinomadura algeriensis]MBE1533103.1 hypothetical protein [Actinomadura algeriensis]